MTFALSPPSSTWHLQCCTRSNLITSSECGPLALIRSPPPRAKRPLLDLERVRIWGGIQQNQPANDDERQRMEDGVRKRLRADEPQSLSSFDNTSPSKRTRGRIVPTYRNDDKGLPTDSSAAERDGAKKPVNHRKIASTSSESDEEEEEEDDDYTSSSGSDSDSGSGSDEDGEHEDQEADYSSDQASGAGSSLPRISAQQKPRIHRTAKEPDLLSRLSAFLPKMKSANEDLQREIAAGRGKDLQLDEVENQEEGQYIEMNLGLGVLEEKRADGSSSTDDEEIGDGPEPANNGDAAGLDTKLRKDSDILDKLMGKKKSSDQKPTIQELTEPRSP